MSRVEYDYDIVIVGSGVAGLSAAVSATEKANSEGRSIRILIVERANSKERGGLSRWSTAYMRMKDKSTPADNFENDFRDFSGGHYQRKVVETLSREAGVTIAWLERKGLEFGHYQTFFPVKSNPRIVPKGQGQAVVDKLFNNAIASGVEIAYESTMWRISLGDDGSVNGAYVRGRDGKSALVSCRTLILASGGFEGNKEMLTRYFGSEAYQMKASCPGVKFNFGEPIEAALAIGAGTYGQWDNAHFEPVDLRDNGPEPVVMVYNYGILVDQNGKRFIDEGSNTVEETFENVARSIWKLPNHVAFLISDQKIFDIPNYKSSVLTSFPPFSSSSLDALAKDLNIDPEGLKKTVANYNSAISGSSAKFDPYKKDGLNTKGLSPEKSNWSVAIDKPPFVGFPLITGLEFTYGGLLADEKARVVSYDGYAIPGLYAAGEITGMYFRKYVGGTSFLRGAVFGKIAGEEALDYIKSP
ncbi:MAG: FAD-binding protein [Nitrososphaerota archaeon]|nr:FAD-binding protein [Nitrososphaerota archaeon]